MLTPAEQAEQAQINAATKFDRRLAALTQEQIRELRPFDKSRLERYRGELDALAARVGREDRCEQAMKWARGGLAEGCDSAMQQLAEAAGDGRLPEWGPDTDPWMALQASVELHAMSLALDDLLTDEQRRATRIAGTAHAGGKRSW